MGHGVLLCLSEWLDAARVGAEVAPTRSGASDVVAAQTGLSWRVVLSRTSAVPLGGRLGGDE